MDYIRVIAVRQGPHIINETCHQDQQEAQQTAALLSMKDFTVVITAESDRPHRTAPLQYPSSNERFLIKRWDRRERRMYFWTTPWARKLEDGTIHQTGGWCPASKHATIYGDPDTAERVNLLRSLEGTVDVARP